ncbi:unnamed protein product [Acidithrix sp. C25]|nr:unnamed protein product [Acidithrix sp. C25]
MFTPDSATKATCTSSACLSAWPAVSSVHLVVGVGLNKTKVSFLKESNDSSQVVYGGHPLYRFAGDTSPGATNGQGVVAFGGTWYVVSANGTPITTP